MVGGVCVRMRQPAGMVLEGQLVRVSFPSIMWVPETELSSDLMPRSFLLLIHLTAPKVTFLESTYKIILLLQITQNNWGLQLTTFEVFTRDIMVPKGATWQTYDAETVSSYKGKLKWESVSGDLQAPGSISNFSVKCYVKESQDRGGSQSLLLRFLNKMLFFCFFAQRTYFYCDWKIAPKTKRVRHFIMLANWESEFETR